MLIVRALLILVVWVLAWMLVKPSTQTMRVVRAGLVVLGLLLVLGIVQANG
jgi:uncharacterized membrane protein